MKPYIYLVTTLLTSTLCSASEFLNPDPDMLNFSLEIINLSAQHSIANSSNAQVNQQTAIKEDKEYCLDFKADSLEFDTWPSPETKQSDIQTEIDLVSFFQEPIIQQARCSEENSESIKALDQSKRSREKIIKALDNDVAKLFDALTEAPKDKKRKRSDDSRKTETSSKEDDEGSETTKSKKSKFMEELAQLKDPSARFIFVNCLRNNCK